MSKKRTLSLLTALCLLLSALILPVSAEGSFFFVAVDDAVPLTLSVGPHEAAAGLYMPYTVFDAAPGGVVTAYNPTEQTLVLFTRTQRLIYDLESGTVSDENGDTEAVLTTYRNGILYIPIANSAAHFGLSYSLLTSKDGYPVLRFTTGAQAYDDAAFLEKAEPLIAKRVADAQTQTPDPPPAVEPPPPVDDPVIEPPPVDDPPVDDPITAPSTAYLAITDLRGMADAAAVLERNGLSAAFFLTAEEIDANPTQVCALYTAGHTLGVTISADETDVSAALAAANDALDRVLHRKTLLALVWEGQEADLIGYRVFVRSQTPISTDTLLSTSGQDILVPCGAEAVRVMTTLNNAGLPLRLLRETTILSAPTEELPDESSPAGD